MAQLVKQIINFYIFVYTLLDMNIDDLYQITRMLLNVNARGNFSPSDFNRAVNFGIDKIFDSYIFDINQATNKENRGLSGTGFESLPERIREKIQHFFKDASCAFSSGSFTLPTDCAWVDSIYYNSLTEIESCKNAKEFKTIQNYIASSPTVQYPIYLRNGDTFKVVPSTILSGVTAFYMRRPLIAKWTFLQVGGNPLYNPSASDFMDIDLHNSEFYNLAVLVLSYFGLNLSNQDVQAAAQNMQNQETNEENNLQ